MSSYDETLKELRRRKRLLRAALREKDYEKAHSIECDIYVWALVVIQQQGHGWTWPSTFAAEVLKVRQIKYPRYLA